MKSKLLVSLFFITTLSFAQNKRILSDFQNNEHIKSLKLNKLKSHANVNKNPNDVSSFNNVLKQRLDSTYYSSHFNNSIGEYKDVFIYDQNGNNTLNSYYYKDTLGVWKINTKNYFTYDAFEKLINTIYTYWDDNSNNFINSSKHEYSYNANGQNTQEISYNWDSNLNQWKLQSKNELAYDNNGNKLQQLNFYWDSNVNQWILTNKNDFSYSNGNCIQVLSSTWNSGTNQWTASYKTEYSYNINGKVTQELNSQWNTTFTQWTVSYKIEYIYDANENMIQELSSNWNSTIGQWNTSSKSEIIYDNNFSFNQLLLPNDYNGEYVNYFEHMLTEYRAFNMNNNGFWENNGIQNFYYSQQNVNALNSIEKSEIKIYPNPASTYLTINLTNNSSQTEFELFNIQGERLISKTIGKKETINIEHLSNGFYLYSLTVDGKKHTGKIVKND